MKFIVVLGGTMSGIGKGVVGSSIAYILQSRKHPITFIKIDPYLNIDSGLISPIEHGEVFVLSDGSEVDLDFGSYERLLDLSFTSENSITSGKVYSEILKKERAGEFLGKTVQAIPHMTDLIKTKIWAAAEKPLLKGMGSNAKLQKPEICIIELGGTVGDIESNLFCEAIRQLKNELPREDFLILSIDYLMKQKNGELKTKLVQNAFKKFFMLGLKPDILVATCYNKINDETKDKLSLFCEIQKDCIFANEMVEDTMEIPDILEKQKIYQKIVERLNLKGNPNIKIPSLVINKTEDMNKKACIALVGKYTENKDAYLSVNKALEISSKELNIHLTIKPMDSEDINETNVAEKLADVDGIIVPGGFGSRGIEGKIATIKYAREENIPLLGICLGLQCIVIEFCRNVLNIQNATSEEFDPNTSSAVIKYMAFQNEKKKTTMRLGENETIFRNGSTIKKLYGDAFSIKERHRHKYEVNPEYVDAIENAGLLFVGTDKEGRRMEILEIPNHRFFAGTQYHPEFTARINHPNKIFSGLLESACSFQQEKKKTE